MSSALSYRLLGILRTTLNRRHCLRLLSKITDSCNFCSTGSAEDRKNSGQGILL